MKQLEVQIMGHGYVLSVSEGDEARLQAAVRKVDAAMCRIRDSGKHKARDRIAVLAALNLVFDLAPRSSSATAALDGAGAAKAAMPADFAAAHEPPAAADSRLAALLQRLDAALADDANGG